MGFTMYNCNYSCTL